MALIHTGSRCPICHDRLRRPYTATWGIAFPPTHRLFPFCDAPLHLDCLATWPDREEFSEQYFVRRLAEYWRGEWGILLEVTDRWFLACAPRVRTSPFFAWVELRDWPLDLHSPRTEWTAYVERGFRHGLVGEALDAAETVMSEVRRAAPTFEALEAMRLAAPPAPDERRSLADFRTYLTTLWGDHANSIDWQSWDEAERDYKYRSWDHQAHERAVDIMHSNALAARLLRRLESSGALRCPHCKRESYDFRFVDKSPQEKSYFICGLCGCSFAGSEGS